jgi:hypothetical protein
MQTLIKPRDIVAGPLLMNKKRDKTLRVKRVSLPVVNLNQVGSVL